MISPLFQGHYHPIKITRFKPFGCQAYVLNHDSSKLQPTAKQMIMVGIEPGSNAYRLWDKSTRRIVISSDVRFNELSFPAVGHPLTPSNSQIIDVFPDVLATISAVNQNPSFTIDQPADTSTTAVFSTSIIDDHQEPSIPEEFPSQSLHHDKTIPFTPPDETPARRSSRVTGPPTRYGFIARETSSSDDDNPTY